MIIPLLIRKYCGKTLAVLLFYAITTISMETEDAKESEYDDAIDDEDDLSLEDFIFEYESVMKDPEYASMLINRYITEPKPSKSSKLRGDHDDLESAVLGYLEERGCDNIMLYHNANSDNSAYTPNESLSKQYNRILYGRIDNSNGNGRIDKAKKLSKLLQDYASYTAAKGGFDAQEFVSLAKKANNYISRHIGDRLLVNRLTFRAKNNDGRISLYANRNISGNATLLCKENDSMLYSDSSIREAVSDANTIISSNNNNAYYPTKEKRGFLAKIGDAFRFAAIGYNGAYERINNVVMAVDNNIKNISRNKRFRPLRETQYTAIGL